MDSVTLVRAYLVVCVISFIALIVLGRMPSQGMDVSRMRYVVGTSLIGLFSILAIDANAFLSGYYGRSTVALVPILLVAAASGFLSAVLALGRSHDAGRGRIFAAIGVVPLAGLWLAFSPPLADPARPPYQPDDKRLRFLFASLALIASIVVPRLVEQMLPILVASEPKPVLQIHVPSLEKSILATNASLPTRLDAYTVLEHVDLDRVSMKIYNRHSLSMPSGTDYNGIGYRIKENSVDAICASNLIKSALADGYYLVYTYRLDDESSIQGFSVVYSDCAK